MTFINLGWEQRGQKQSVLNKLRMGAGTIISDLRKLGWEGPWTKICDLLKLGMGAERGAWTKIK